MTITAILTKALAYIRRWRQRYARVDGRFIDPLADLLDVKLEAPPRFYVEPGTVTSVSFMPLPPNMPPSLKKGGGRVIVEPFKMNPPKNVDPKLN